MGVVVCGGFFSEFLVLYVLFGIFLFLFVILVFEVGGSVFREGEFF